MDWETSVPRVNYELMPRYMNQKVRLLCKFERMEGKNVIVTTSDRKQVQVITSQKKTFDTPFVEIDGIVQGNDTIAEDDHVDLGDKCDLDAYNELVKLATGKFAHMF